MVYPLRGREGGEILADKSPLINTISVFGHSLIYFLKRYINNTNTQISRLLSKTHYGLNRQPTLYSAPLTNFLDFAFKKFPYHFCG